MNNFKPGDKVVCIRDSDDGSFFGHPGETFTVLTCYQDNLTFEEMPISECPVDAARFELIGKNNFGIPYLEKESDLDFLVRISNLGMRAENLLLTEYFAEVERRSNHKDGWRDFTQNPYSGYSIYRVKSKPTFEPFYVGPEICTAPHSYCGHDKPDCELRGGLLVILENDLLSIGDYHFNSKELHGALANLVRDSSEVQHVTGHRLGCMRNGICIDGKLQISWHDAENILNALDKFYG
jgi:hypothetical protein